MIWFSPQIRIQDKFVYTGNSFKVASGFTKLLCSPEKRLLLQFSKFHVCLRIYICVFAKPPDYFALTFEQKIQIRMVTDLECTT